MIFSLLALFSLGAYADSHFRCYDVPIFGKKSCRSVLTSKPGKEKKRCGKKRKVMDTNEKGKYKCLPGKDNKKCLVLTGYEACPETCGDDPTWHFETPTQGCEWTQGDKTKCAFKDKRGRTGNEGCPESCAAFRDCPERPPHIVLVLADDLGTANVGFLRELYAKDTPDEDSEELKKRGAAETMTPIIDELAKDGVIMKNHYSFRICSPSRCALQSGRFPVHVNTVNTGIGAFNEKDPFGGAVGIPRGMTCMAEVLKKAGYATHAVGKWDAGMATPEHTPHGRGYDTFTGFYQHANKYWTKGMEIAATGELDNCMNELMDFSEYSDEYSGPVKEKALVTDKCKDSMDKDPFCYKEYAFKLRGKKQIFSHDMKDPMFYFHSFAIAHTPLEVPKFYMEYVQNEAKKRGGEFDEFTRHTYAAMVSYMDDAIGEIVDALKRKGMWDRTILAFMSDNGGPIYSPGSANNYPLRGGKYSDFEGGVRSVSFLSGGWLPKKVKGTTFSGVVSIADWYATFAELAGAGDVSRDPKVDAANKKILEDYDPKEVPFLHHPDSRSFWKNLLENTNPRPDVFHLSEKSVIQWPYKLVTGEHFYGRHQNPRYPTCDDRENVSKDGPLVSDIKVMDKSVPMGDTPEENDILLWVNKDCVDGCLFNIEDDPSESEDLINTSQEMRDLAKELQDKLDGMNRNNYTPERGEVDKRLCTVGLKNGGAYGPFHDIEGFYTEPEVDADEDILDLYDFVEENMDTFVALFRWWNLEFTKREVWNLLEQCYSDPIPPPFNEDQIKDFIQDMAEYAQEEELKNWNATMQVFIPVMVDQFPQLFPNAE